MDDVFILLRKLAPHGASLFIVQLILHWPALGSAQCVDYKDFLHARGSLSMEAFDIEVSGSTAYVGTEYGLHLVDISNPDAPAVVDSFQAIDSAHGLTLSGNVIFLCERYSGFQIIDVSDPGSMSALSSVNTDTLGFVGEIRVIGSLAYVTGGYEGLHVFDVSDLAHPSLINTIPIPGFAYDVQVAGDYAYVPNGTSLQVIDISDPLSASIVAHAGISNTAGSIALRDHYAYVGNKGTGQGPGGLYIVDITDPANPAVVDSVAVQTYSVAWGQEMYVANGSGIRVFEDLNPALPVFLGAFDWFGGATSMAVMGDLAFLVSTRRMQIIDVTNPRAVETLGRLRIPGDSDFGFGVDVNGSVACVATDSVFATIDVTNPAAPVQLAQIGGSQFTDVVAHGDTAFVIGASFFKIFDISIPATPSLIGSVNLSAAPISLQISGSLAFVAAYFGGLKIIDFSDPSSPAVVGEASVGGSQGVAVSGQYAYLTSTTGGGVYVYNVANPSMPVGVGGLEMLGSPYGITVVGNHAYMVGQFSFWVLDVSNPTSPFLVSEIDLPDAAHGVDVDGPHAYVTGYGSGLQVIDISDPASPRVLGSSLTPMRRGSMTVAQALDVSEMFVFVLGGAVFEDDSNFWVVPGQCLAPVPLQVMLHAQSQSEGIRLTWDPGHDADIRAYYLDRAAQAEGGYARLNGEAIRSGGPNWFLDMNVEPGSIYYYRLEILDRMGNSNFIGPVSARFDPERGRLHLFKSRPNPFRAPGTTIEFDMGFRGRAQVTILDASGRKVRVLLDKVLEQNHHALIWDGRDDRGELVPPGVYFYQLEAGNFSQARSIVRLN